MTVSALRPTSVHAGVKPSTVAPSWRGIRTIATLATLAFAGMGASGCSMSYQLGSLFGGNEKSGKDETTGSTASPVALRSGAEKSLDGDLAVARRAAAEMFAAGAKDTSTPWQNPETGARGMVTPIAAAYTQDGFTCRDFLASVVRDRVEIWLQGEACRLHHGKWEVRTLKPWKRA